MTYNKKHVISSVSVAIPVSKVRGIYSVLYSDRLPRSLCSFAMTTKTNRLCERSEAISREGELPHAFIPYRRRCRHFPRRRKQKVRHIERQQNIPQHKTTAFPFFARKRSRLIFVFIILPCRRSAFLRRID